MEDRVKELKAEIFDLQVQYGQIRKAIEDKLQELNTLMQKDVKRPGTDEG